MVRVRAHGFRFEFRPGGRRKNRFAAIIFCFTVGSLHSDFGPRSVHGVWNATLTTHRVPSNCPLADALGVHHAPRGWRSFIAARRRCCVPVVRRKRACFSSCGATRWRLDRRGAVALAARASNGCVGLLAVRADSNCWRKHERRGGCAVRLHNSIFAKEPRRTLVWRASLFCGGSGVRVCMRRTVWCVVGVRAAGTLLVHNVHNA